MLKLVLRLFLALALPGAAAACAPNGSMPASAPNGSLVSSLQVETTPGSVRLALQVTNAGSAPVPLEFASGQTHDFVVLQGDRELWRWSADRMFTQALRTETLGAGETRTFDATWTPPAGTRGDLVARGFLTARGERAERQTVFRLP
ncbi:MAG TPA: BsuPI-related putative proteinase inhibitor [Longimicrobiaceae bacterium]